jgi:photosystem II stability/assembly factor-like uncharacterized protein
MPVNKSNKRSNLVIKSLSLFILVHFSHYVSADPVTIKTARQVAVNFANSKSSLKSTMAVMNNYTSFKDSIPVYYTFNFDKGGWVIVAADDNVIPIIAYSLDGSADKDAINPSAKLWLDDVANQIYKAAKISSLRKSAEQLWSEALNYKFKIAGKSVSPLLKGLQWNQTEFYNDYCPSDTNAPDGYNGRVPAGCVAIAMAQIMKYYSYPSKGIGSNKYNHPIYGELSVDFANTSYNWNDMPFSLTAPNKDAATLIYQCGVAVNMDFGSNSSAAYDVDARYALVHFFGYSDSMTLYNRDNNSASKEIWNARLKMEMDARRPVYYSGFDILNTTGHAFVCDGYDNSFPTKFHFNWGWGGSDNGYYEIGNLIPNSYDDFSYYNNIITYIKPGSIDSTLLSCIIISPNNNVLYSMDSSIDVKVFVAKGAPEKIYLFIDGIINDSVSAYPYKIKTPLNKVPNGKHQLKIIAVNKTISSIDSIVFYVYDTLSSGCWKLEHIIPTEEEIGIKYISIVDTNTIWVTVGGKNNLLATTSNGGSNWSDRSISNVTNQEMEISNICGVSASKAFACLNPKQNTGGSILTTADSGKTWTEQNTANFENSWANWVYFFDTNNGVCMGDPFQKRFFVYTTNDGGNNWNRVDENNIPPALDNEAGLENSFEVYGNSIWYGTSVGRIYKSSDKGLTWSVQDSIFDSRNFYYFKFKDSTHIFAHEIDNSDLLYKSDDAGKTWTKFFGKYNMRNLLFLPGTDSTWINFNNTTKFSTNDCSTFSYADRNISISSAGFRSQNYGWGGAYFSSDLNGVGIYRWLNRIPDITSYKITFKVASIDSIPLPDVEAIQNFDNSIITDSAGIAAFDATKYGNPYIFKFSKEGYLSNGDYYYIQSDTTISVTLIKADSLMKDGSSITFHVISSFNDPVEGISIYCNDSLIYTDAEGNAVFTNIQIGNTEIYSALYGNEYVECGTVITNEKENFVNIVIPVDTQSVIIQPGLVSTVVYPNPASDMVTITSDETITALTIYDISGKILVQKQNGSRELKISVHHFQNGIYFIQLSRKEGIGVYKLVKHSNN